MASGEALLAKMRASGVGHGQSDFCRVLEYYGFINVRPARHGLIYRHPDLAQHPDPSVRQLMIPTGRDLPRYVAQKVVRAVDALDEGKKSENEGGDHG